MWNSHHFKSRIDTIVALLFLISACNWPILQASETPSLPPAVAPSVQSGVSTPPAGSRQLNMVIDGPVRTLPSNILGASAEALIEHLMDNPAKVAAIHQTAPGVIRFPGGSQSNYYDWQTGLLQMNPQANSSAYYKFWANIAPKIARSFPAGVTMEAYAQFASQTGSQVILVPNLETSNINAQVSWFKQLAADNSLPQNIELGNEFYIAMAGDPNVMSQWPNEPASLAVMQQYEAALRPIVGSGAKFAIQSAGSSFAILTTNPTPFQKRLLDWDKALAPADWFQAVTIHLYPDPVQMGAEAGNPGPDRLFQLLMGRADAGVQRALSDLAARMPGKEIWITEWSPRGGNYGDLVSHPERVPPQMTAQLVARETLAILRQGAVTKSLFFTLSADSTSPFQMYVKDPNGNYLPMPATVVLQWFNEAANGTSTFQRVVDKDSQQVTALGKFSENYRPVEGGLFHSTKQTVLILQNSSTDTIWYDPQLPYPARSELLVADNFTDPTPAAAQIQTLNPNGPIVLPPYSIARLIWNNP
jgi:hypothetical protein